MNKKVLLPTVALTVLAATGYGVSFANAQEIDDQPVTLIQRIANRFNLNQDEVEQTFQEHKQYMGERLRQGYIQKLDQAVIDGLLTQDQKNALLAKKEEMRESYNYEDLTKEEILAQKKEHHEKFETWAEDEGIDLDALGFDKGMGKHGMKKHAYWNFGQ
jgi:hypothetical protein